ncbi:nuclear transport factor 2 family protein [Litorivivens sp.]|uniref:nuclear transport factor 2 family protein n=1 Tax=Litorivivens sp. TaxID=2020868 RepID=UPI00356336BF
MDIIALFKAYAEAFELTYEDDDWSRLEPHFAPQACYLPGNGQTLNGREKVIAYLRDNVNKIDRRFDSRAPSLVDAAITDNQFKLTWRAEYKKEGLPDLVIGGLEIATFEDGRIVHLEDIYEPEVVAGFEWWMSEYGDRLV